MIAPETLRERQEQAIITAFSKFRGDLRLAERKALAEAFLDVLGDDGWTLASGDNGAALITAERMRQMTEEGYTAEHDARQKAALVYAGIAYAIAALEPSGPSYAAGDWWPWSAEAWKPTGDVVRDLTKSGALIAAAIDAAKLGSGK